MICITVNRADFEYDLYGLVRAFFPLTETGIFYDTEDGYTGPLPYQAKDRTSPPSDAEAYLTVRYIPRGASILWQKRGGERKGTDVACPLSWPDYPAEDKATRPAMKNMVKAAVYQLLSDATGKTLPWGMLTGIRPTRIALGMIDAGADTDAVQHAMEQDYFCTPEKADLAVSIAAREHRVLSRLPLSGYSLYAGIPFCPTTCAYCSFMSESRDGKDDLVREYLTALIREIRAVPEIFSGKPDTIYIGGGTPTALTTAELDRLLSAIDASVPMDAVREYTVEAGRPDSITREKLAVLKSHGVNRISVNPQTLNDRTLQRIGRRTTTAEFQRAYAMAREEGFQNINTDIILGLPGEGEAEVRHTLSGITALAPDDLTVHSLAIKAGSAFYRHLKDQGTAQAPDAGEAEHLMELSHEAARASGLFPYYLYRQKNMTGNLENTGFAAPGKEGLYNILMMEERETIAACGAGTASKYIRPDGTRAGRTDNVRSVTDYISGVDRMIERKRRMAEKLYGGKGEDFS